MKHTYKKIFHTHEYDYRKILIGESVFICRKEQAL